MKKEEKRKPGKKKRGKDNIPILLYTESEEKKRKIKTKKRKSAEKRKSHMPVTNIKLYTMQNLYIFFPYFARA